MDDERWRWVVGYEGLYMVSDQGRVMSVPKRAARSNGYMASYDGQILSPSNNTNGYPSVNLHRGGRGRTRAVHRLVAEAFVPNPEGLSSVNHIDEDKTNNSAENLEWCTVGYNNDYGTRQQRVQINQKQRRAVCMMSLDGEVLRDFPTCLSAARYITGESSGKSQRVRVTDNNIRRACRLHQHKAYGYRWEFQQ